MSRIAMEHCLKQLGNGVLRVNLASQRMRQVREGSGPLVSSRKKTGMWWFCFVRLLSKEPDFQ